MKNSPRTLTIAWMLLLLSPTILADPTPYRTESGLEITVVTEGTGSPVRKGNQVRIHESTALGDGTVLFSSFDSDHPISFCQGGGMVIQGLDEAVLGMRPGEVRTVVVPPRLSQRASYPDSFSPDDTLHYRVQLVDIQSDACEQRNGAESWPSAFMARRRS